MSLCSGFLFLTISGGGFASTLSGHACNISQTPSETNKWSIHLYDFGNSQDTGRVVFSTNKNRKIQSVACTSDGKEMIFSFQETTQGDFEIYTLDLETNDLNKLTDNDTDDVDVSISQDGRVVAWQKRLADDRQAITIRTYDGSGDSFTEKSLASANPFVQPSLSGNGKWLALVQMRKSNFLALRYDIENNTYKTIHSIPRRKRLYHPSVSSDGNIFGWVENKKQTRYLVKNISENTTDKLIIGSPGIEHPYISEDGEWVTYSVGQQALLKNIETGATEEIALSDRFLGSYWMGGPKLTGSWQMAGEGPVIFHFLPDGRYLAMQWEEGQGYEGFEYGTYTTDNGEISFVTRENNDGQALTCNKDKGTLCHGQFGNEPGVWGYSFSEEGELVFSVPGDGDFSFDRLASTNSLVDGLWENRDSQQFVHFTNENSDGLGSYFNLFYEKVDVDNYEIFELGTYQLTNDSTGTVAEFMPEKTYNRFGLDCSGNCDSYSVPFSVINQQLAAINTVTKKRVYLDSVFLDDGAPANTAKLVAQKHYEADIAANENYGVGLDDDFRTRITTIEVDEPSSSSFKATFTIDETATALTQAASDTSAGLETRMYASYNDPDGDLGLEVSLRLRYYGGGVSARYVMATCLDESCLEEVYLVETVSVSGDFTGDHSMDISLNEDQTRFVFSIDGEVIASKAISDFTGHEDIIAAGGYSFDPSHFNRVMFRVDAFNVDRSGESALITVHLDEFAIDGKVYDDFTDGLIDNRKWYYDAEDR